MSEKRQTLAVYFISSNTPLHKKWVHLFVNSVPTSYEVNKEGEVRNIRTKRLLKPKIVNSGYYVYQLHTLEGRIINLSMHRLIACLFIPIPIRFLKEGKDQMNLIPNHKDGNKLNTTIDNLEWTDVGENTRHAFDTGLADCSMGENSHLAKITNEQAKEICELLSQKIRPTEVAEITGYPITTIRHIFSGESWKRLAKDYDFQKETKSLPNSISDDIIHTVCKLIMMDRYTDSEIGRMVGLTARYVNDIHRGVRRADITSQYDFPIHDRKAEQEAKVRKACEMLQANVYTINEIAKTSGLHSATVSNIRSGKWYSDISKEYVIKKHECISDDIVHEACKLLQDTDLPYSEISEHTGLDVGYITQLKRGILRPNISSQYDFSHRNN